MRLVRLLNLTVVAALVFAAVYVYRIKFEASLGAAQVAKLRDDIRREHDKIAALRAQWSELDNPNRIQHIVMRHLPLKPVDADQFDTFDRLPLRPPEPEAPDRDPIATIIQNLDTTGSIPARPPAR
jgi:hypothetical protein